MATNIKKKCFIKQGGIALAINIKITVSSNLQIICGLKPPTFHVKYYIQMILWLLHLFDWSGLVISKTYPET